MFSLSNVSFVPLSCREGLLSINHKRYIIYQRKARTTRTGNSIVVARWHDIPIPTPSPSTSGWRDKAIDEGKDDIRNHPLHTHTHTDTHWHTPNTKATGERAVVLVAQFHSILRNGWVFAQKEKENRKCPHIKAHFLCPTYEA